MKKTFNTVARRLVLSLTLVGSIQAITQEEAWKLKVAMNEMTILNKEQEVQFYNVINLINKLTTTSYPSRTKTRDVKDQRTRPTTLIHVGHQPQSQHSNPITTFVKNHYDELRHENFKITDSEQVISYKCMAKECDETTYKFFPEGRVSDEKRPPFCKNPDHDSLRSELADDITWTALQGGIIMETASRGARLE